MRTLYKWDLIIVEEHLDWKIYFSKNWKYLLSKELEEKRNRVYKLPMAPANKWDFVEMKKEIEYLEEIDTIQKEEEKEKSQHKKKSYYERTWKKHPWMNKFKIRKTKKLDIAISEQKRRKT